MMGTTCHMLLLIVVLVSFVMATGGSVCPDATNVDEQHVFQLDDVTTCYEYVVAVETQVSYSEAAKTCSSKNGYLLTIKNNKTQVVLVNKLQMLSETHTILLGLRQDGDGPWKWPGGEPATFTNWEQRRTTCSTCHCARMRLDRGGMWEAFNCGLEEWYPAYVCQYGAAFSINTNSIYQKIAVVGVSLLAMVFSKISGGH